MPSNLPRTQKTRELRHLLEDIRHLPSAADVDLPPGGWTPDQPSLQETVISRIVQLLSELLGVSGSFMLRGDGAIRLALHARPRSMPTAASYILDEIVIVDPTTNRITTVLKSRFGESRLNDIHSWRSFDFGRRAQPSPGVAFVAPLTLWERLALECGDTTL